MARLLASYAKGRFVFIDLRDVTPHVADEIRFSFLAMGVERCVFITDTTQEREASMDRIVTAVGDSDVKRGDLLLLPCAGDKREEIKRLASELRQLLVRIPPGCPAIPWEALQFVRARVSKVQWPSSYFETERGLAHWAVGAQVALLIFALLLGMRDAFLRNETGGNLAATFICLPYVILGAAFVGATFRMLRQRLVEIRVRKIIKS